MLHSSPLQVYSSLISRIPTPESPQDPWSAQRVSPHCPAPVYPENVWSAQLQSMPKESLEESPQKIPISIAHTFQISRVGMSDNILHSCSRLSSHKDKVKHPTRLPDSKVLGPPPCLTSTSSKGHVVEGQGGLKRSASGFGLLG